MPEVSDPIGSIILDKSADDMEFYLENEYFPPEGDEAEDMPVRRRSSRRDDDDEPPFDEDRRASRRTPASRRERF